MQVKRLHPTSTAGKTHSRACLAPNMSSHSEAAVMQKKCEIATVTATVNIMIYYHQKTNTSLKPAWEFVFFNFSHCDAEWEPDVGQYIYISVDTGEAVKTKKILQLVHSIQKPTQRPDNWPRGHHTSPAVWKFGRDALLKETSDCSIGPETSQRNDSDMENANIFMWYFTLKH